MVPAAAPIKAKATMIVDNSGMGVGVGIVTVTVLSVGIHIACIETKSAGIFNESVLSVYMLAP